MKKLADLTPNAGGVISAIKGDNRFVNRVTAIGLTPGSRVVVVKNDQDRPLLVYSRDTMIALNRAECKGIEVEEVTGGGAR